MMSVCKSTYTWHTLPELVDGVETSQAVATVSIAAVDMVRILCELI